MRDGLLALRRVQRQVARPAVLRALAHPQVAVGPALFGRQACGLERHDQGVRPQHHRLLLAQAEGLDHAKRRAHVGVVGAHALQQRVDVQALGRPALVALGHLVALVLVQLQAIEGRPAHEARLAGPQRQAAQKAQVGLDRGRLQPVVAPHLHHGSDVLLPQVARVGQGLEAGTVVQGGVEAAQEVGAILPGLV